MSTKQLTASEIAGLWTGYMQNSMTKCVMEYFLANVEDPDIQSCVQHAYDLADSNIKAITEIYTDEGVQVPVGFTDKDVHLQADRLFSDTFFLMYLHHMGKIGLIQYSMLQAMSVRRDIATFFSLTLKNTSDLHDEASNLSLEKGLLIRPPYIPEPKSVEFVQNRSYFSGNSIFSDKRPLNAIEISHLFSNLQTNLLGMMLSVGFAQTAKSKEVRDYMYRGAAVAKKHMKIFANHLIESEVQAPMTWDSQTLDSTDPPFSDKLMMFHNDILVGAGIGNYATASAASLRNDLALDYARLSAEIAQYAKDGAKIMIEHKWLEEPPQSPNRKELKNQK